MVSVPKVSKDTENTALKYMFLDLRYIFSYLPQPCTSATLSQSVNHYRQGWYMTSYAYFQDEGDAVAARPPRQDGGRRLHRRPRPLRPRSSLRNGR